MKNIPVYLFVVCIISAIFVLLTPSFSQAYSKWQEKYDKSLILLKSKKYGPALAEAGSALKLNKNPYTLELEGNIFQFMRKYRTSNLYLRESLAMLVSGYPGKTAKISVRERDNFLKSVKNGIGLNYLLMGNGLLKGGNLSKAIAYYKKGMGYATKEQVFDMLALNSAMAYENIKNYKAAIKLTDKVITGNTGDPFAYFIRGRAEYDAGNTVFSVNDFKTAVKLDPSNGLFKKALIIAEKNINGVKAGK